MLRIRPIRVPFSAPALRRYFAPPGFPHGQGRACRAGGQRRCRGARHRPCSCSQAERGRPDDPPGHPRDREGRAAQSYMMSSASLAALVGTAATALAFSNIQQSSNSSSAGRRSRHDDHSAGLRDRFDGLAFRIPHRARPIASDQTAAAATSGAVNAKTSNTIADAKSVQTTNNGNWELNDKNSAIDVSQLSRPWRTTRRSRCWSTRMPASCPKDSTRTMPRATAVSPMRSASARGGRTCVAISSACPSDHISAMVRTGRTPLVRTATGWTTRLATRATSWCSAR